ncbi:MAG: hypothetical protein V1813_00410 [Candidatus Aenigmatarchaeota archaeon]
MDFLTSGAFLLEFLSTSSASFHSASGTIAAPERKYSNDWYADMNMTRASAVPKKAQNTLFHIRLIA